MIVGALLLLLLVLVVGVRGYRQRRRASTASAEQPMAAFEMQDVPPALGLPQDAGDQRWRRSTQSN